MILFSRLDRHKSWLLTRCKKKERKKEKKLVNRCYCWMLQWCCCWGSELCWRFKDSIEIKEKKKKTTFDLTMYLFYLHCNLLMIQKYLKDEVSWIEWKKALSDALIESQQTFTVTEKASKIYGVTEVKRVAVQE